jgi:uncharacterized protein YqjF (DUF2071 family)
MLSFLKDHPFAVEAFFERSLVITYAIPKEYIQQLIPERLELDTLNNSWAFMAVAMVQTKALRPKGFPEMFGNDFFLIGFRVFVRYNNKAGKSLRGLYILKSETNKRKMTFFGNLFTHYNYTTTDIEQTVQNGITTIRSNRSGFNVQIEDAENDNIPLPAGSPFTDWKEARRFAGPLPFTFTCDETSKSVLIIEGVRQNWKPAPVKVIDCHFSFIDKLNLPDVKLANAFIIRNIPYYWKKGKIEQWK